MAYAAYVRKSRGEEGTTMEETLQRHREQLSAFAAQQGLWVEDWYEEVVSGERLYARPQMLRLLEQVAANRYEGVLCMDMDRLGRGNMSDQGLILETLKEHHTKILTPRKIYDLEDELDEEYSEFESFFARRELKLIKRRMQRGYRKSWEAGGFLAMPPYGYRRAQQKGLPSLAIVPEEAAFVQLAFQRYVQEGQSCQQIADTLTALGAIPPKGGRFHKNSVLHLLQNPVYCGRVRWNRLPSPVENPGVHPPIISPQLFDAAQRRHASRCHPRAPKGSSFLSGIIRCRQCGQLLQLSCAKGRRYLRCPTKGCQPVLSLSAAEDAVLHQFLPQLSFLSLVPSDDSSSTSALTQGALARLEQKKERLYGFLENGTYDAATFAQRMELLQQQQEQLLSRPPSPAPIPQSFAAYWQQLSAPAQSQWLRLFTQAIWYLHTPQTDRLEVIWAQSWGGAPFPSLHES